MKKREEEEREKNENFPNLMQEPIAEYEVEKKKMTFDEAVAACNGITVDEFFKKLEVSLKEYYNKHAKDIQIKNSQRENNYHWSR